MYPLSIFIQKYLKKEINPLDLFALELFSHYDIFRCKKIID